MNSVTTASKDNCLSSPETRVWFDEIIGSIRADQYKLECNLATPDERNFYQSAILGNDLDIFKNVRDLGIRLYVSRMLGDFIQELYQRKIEPVQLAFSYNHDSLLCWAVIKEGDDNCEKGLILSKAMVNSKYCDYNFTLSLTIVSEEDMFSIPSHYSILKKK